jgi:hypothetical protein
MILVERYIVCRRLYIWVGERRLAVYLMHVVGWSCDWGA